MILRVILHFSETHSALKTLRYKDWADGRVVGLFVVGEKGETEMGRLEPLSHTTKLVLNLLVTTVQAGGLMMAVFLGQDYSV